MAGNIGPQNLIDILAQAVIQATITGSSTEQVVFQDASGASGGGTAVSTKGYRTLVIEIFGASTPAGTVSFQAASVSGTYAALSGVNLNGLIPATSASVPSSGVVQYQFDVEAVDSVQMPLAWTSGTVTVQGRLQA